MPEVKKRIKSKKKGNTYERKIVHFFNDYISKFKNSDIVKFERTAASGGLSEQGDIQCVYGKQSGKRFVRRGYVDIPFGFECKHNKKVTLDSLFNDASNKVVADIFDQVNDESKKLEKVVLLIAKIKNIDDLVITKIYYKDILKMKFSYNKENWFAYKLEEFFNIEQVKMAIKSKVESIKL